MKKYRYKDKVIQVINGLGGDVFFTGWYSWTSGGSHRLVSKDLPPRDTREKAQEDLDVWAEKKGLEAAR